MERDEAYNARDLAYHMTEEDYEDMMHGMIMGGEMEWEDDAENFSDDDDGEFDRFQDDFDDEDYADDVDLYAGWDNDIEQGRWDE